MRVGHVALTFASLTWVACLAYTGSADATLFLSGRLVSPTGDPTTRCHAGVEEDGTVDNWRPVDSDFREMFLLPAGRVLHRIVIQCRGYQEYTIDVAVTSSAQWRVHGREYAPNETVELGIIVFTPG